MRQKERKALQDFMNQHQDFSREQDRIFKELQDMSRAADMVVYCSAESNAKQLYELGITRAKGMYERYMVLGAKLDLLNDYGAMLADLNFWR